MVIKLYYPNGKKVTFKKNIINFKNRGMNLEKLINDANKYYIDNNIAVIYKKPTPIGLVDVDYNNGIINKAFFKEKSTLDYNGIYKGKYVDFDVKESHLSTSFPLRNVSSHQILHMRRILLHGGITFLIININNKYFILKGEDFIFYIDNVKKSSIPYDYFISKCYEIDLSLKPNLDYIKVLDEIYFKGDNLNEEKEN